MMRLPNQAWPLIIQVQFGGELDTGINIFSCERRILLKDFFDRISCAQKLHNGLNGDPSSRNDRAPITNIRMNVYAICHNGSLDIGLIVLAPVPDGSVFSHRKLFD